MVAEQGGDLEELLLARKAEVDRADELELYFDSNPEHEHEAAETPEQEMTEEQPEPTDNVEDVESEDSDGPIA